MDLVLRMYFTLALIFLADPLCLQAQEPEFTAASVMMGAAPLEILSPGSGGITIYGHRLGPDLGHSCAGTPDYGHPLTPNPRNPDPRFIVLSNYPKELCGVQVWVGDKQAGLLYVAENQINLQLPQDSAENGLVELRVVYQGRSSSVMLPAGFEKTTVSLDQPAYTGMPVWLKVKMPRASGQVEYPDILGPAAFGCNEVEVRRDGQPLTRQAGSVWNDIGAFSGNACGTSVPVEFMSHKGRLPIHLLYRFDVAGTYEVRFTRYDAGRAVIAESEWTPLVVQAWRADQRAKWLDELRRQHPMDPAELVTDVLPAVMGYPDDASLEILMSYLDHPERSVRAFAIRGLHYWPDDVVAARLVDFVRKKGPTEQVIDRLLRVDPGLRNARSAEIVKASLPYLASESPALIGGAVDTIRSLQPARDEDLSRAMLQAADHVMRTADSQDVVTFVMLLAQKHDEQIHQFLWRYASPDIAFGSPGAYVPFNQVVGEIARFHDPADLPRLTALLERSGSDNSALANRLIVVASVLYENYGAAAVPYLEQVLREWPASDMVTRVSEQALLKAGDPVAYRFLEQNSRLRMEMYPNVRNAFPELKDANDDVVAAFVHARAQAAR